MNILTRAFWGDEAWTVLISSLPPWDLVATTAADFHPPLYYLIVHYWIQIFGNTEVSVRSLSLIFWLLCIPVIYLLSKSLRLNSFYTLFFILYSLFNPFIFLYAFEARNYTLFIFLSICSIHGFYRIVTSKKVSLLTINYYLLTTLLGLYTHYFMFFLLFTQSLIVLLFHRNFIKRFFIFYFLFFILYLPWLPLFLSQAKSVASGYWIARPTLETIRDTAKVLVRGEQNSIFYPHLSNIYLIYFSIAAFFGWKNKKLFTRETLLIIFWILIPFILPLIISLYRPIFFYRYLVFLSIPLMLLPLYLLSNSNKIRPSRLLILNSHFSILISIFPLTLLLIYIYTDILSFSTRTPQLFKSILAKVHAQAKKDDVIYTVLPSFAEVVYYNQYDNHPLPVKIIPKGLQQASGKALLDTYLSKGLLTLENPPIKGRYWLLEPGPKYKLVNNY